VIEIRHRTSGALLRRVERDTLAGADLTNADLCDADLAGKDLRGAILAGAVCRDIRLQGANLERADLRGAFLAQADLRDANLNGALLFSVSLDTADLTGTNLSGANLTGAYAAEAKLNRANLCYASLQSTYLGGADLTGAQLAYTVFADCVSLPLAHGLEAMQHWGPSALDLITLRSGALPEAFLLGVGIPAGEIEALRSLAGESGPYHSCFLAFDAADSDFVAHLQADLAAQDVCCWPYRPDLQAGYVLQNVFNHASRRRGRMILVCSEASVREGRVLQAAQHVTGHRPETDTPRPILILLDGFLIDPQPSLAADAAVGEQRREWIPYLHHCPTLDFRNWKDKTAFEGQLHALLTALHPPAA
jgi:hypothetical protein